MSDETNNMPQVILEVVPPARVQEPPPGENERNSDDYFQPRRIPVSEFPFRVGRHDKSNHVLLLDSAVSRRSIEITREGGHFELRDLGQRSGVLVNGGQVDRRRVLEFDDVITFPNADVKITFRQAPPRPPAPTDSQA